MELEFNIEQVNEGDTGAIASQKLYDNDSAIAQELLRLSRIVGAIEREIPAPKLDVAIYVVGALKFRVMNLTTEQLEKLGALKVYLRRWKNKRGTYKIMDEDGVVIGGDRFPIRNKYMIAEDAGHAENNVTWSDTRIDPFEILPTTEWQTLPFSAKEIGQRFVYAKLATGEENPLTGEKIYNRFNLDNAPNDPYLQIVISGKKGDNRIVKRVVTPNNEYPINVTIPLEISINKIEWTKFRVRVMYNPAAPGGAIYQFCGAGKFGRQYADV